MWVAVLSSRGVILSMFVVEIITKYLREHGFDGLYHDNDCGCSLSKGIIPCCGDFSCCRAGYRIPTPPDHDLFGEAEFIIGPKKEE